MKYFTVRMIANPIRPPAIPRKLMMDSSECLRCSSSCFNYSKITVAASAYRIPFLPRSNEGNPTCSSNCCSCRVTVGSDASSFFEAPGTDPVRATFFMVLSCLKVRFLIGGARPMEILIDNLVEVKSNGLEAIFR